MRSTSRVRLFVVLMSVLLWVVSCQSTQPKTQPAPSSPVTNPFTVDPEQDIDIQALADVVILYDDIPTAALRTQQSRLPQQFLSPKGLSTQAATTEDAAKVYAQMIMNLVGGIRDVNPVMKPVSQYQAGEAQNSKHTIYIGSTFDNPVPAALIQDIAAGASVSWVNYNIWQLGDTLTSLGLSYNGIQTVDAVNSNAATTFNTVDYHGYSFKKDTSAGMEMVQLTTSGAAQVISYATNANGGQTPYAIRSGNFWYVADLPLTYVTETDRYLVFADLLPQMVGVATTCSPKAVIRLEDISPYVNSAEVGRVVDALTQANVPFGVATFPYFIDEPGNTSLTFANNPNTLNVLKNAQSSGLGEIFQHGSYHMYQGLLNPSGISGLDWEFWNINNNLPITGFTADQAVARIQAGKAELEAQGLLPVGWVTPHYAAPIDFLPRFKDVYFRQYERRFIASGDILTGQFMPYPVRDIYNRTLLIPENTNFIGANNTLANVYEKAKANRALNCPWLGMFIHPYVFDPAYTQPGATSIASLQQFIADVRALGYEFVLPSTVDLNAIDTTPTPTFDGKVTAFSLLDGATGADLGTLTNNASFNLSALPSSLNILATTSGAVESVSISLSGTTQTDNTSPYTASTTAITTTAGTFNLSALPYAQDNALGLVGAGLSLSFSIVDDTPPPPVFDGKVISFSLVNAATNTIVGTLSNNATIDFSQLGTDKLSVIANTSGAVESVKFVLNGQDFKVENLLPYAIQGDDNGVYGVWQPAEGTYTLEAQPYAQDDALGDLGQVLSISFKVVKGTTTVQCSSNSSTRQNVSFVNNSNTRVRIDWIDTNCRAVYYRVLSPGSTYSISSYKGHVWRLTDYYTRNVIKTVRLDGSNTKVYVVDSSPNPGPSTNFTSQILVKYSNKCMDAWSTYPFQWTCSSWDGQKYDFNPVAGKTNIYSIVSKSTGQCLDIEGASTSNGAKLLRYACHNNSNQQFELVSAGSSYQLKAVHSGKCLSVTSSWGGAGFVQTTCNSSDGKQIFQFPGK